jgi:hypothetical protein
MANYRAGAPQKNKTHVLWAGDDADDHPLFEEVIEKFPISARLIVVKDCAPLMVYISENLDRLADLIFLDLNKPRKNGIVSRRIPSRENLYPRSLNTLPRRI